MEPLRDKSNNLCRYFLNGNCTRGSMCSFSHDLGTASSLPHSSGHQSSTSVCRYFLRGCCSYGDQCRYTHVRNNDQQQQQQQQQYGKPKTSVGYQGHDGGLSMHSSGGYGVASGVAPTPVPEFGGAIGGDFARQMQDAADLRKKLKKPGNPSGMPQEGFAMAAAVGGAHGGSRGGRGRGGRGGRGRGGDSSQQQRALHQMSELLAGGSVGGGDFTYPKHPKLGRNMHKYAAYLDSGEIGIDDLNSAMWHWSSDDDEGEGGPTSELEMLMAMAMLGGDEDMEDPYGRNDYSDDDGSNFVTDDSDGSDDDDDSDDFENEGAFSGRSSPSPISTKQNAFAEDAEKEGISSKQHQNQPFNFELPD